MATVIEIRDQEGNPTVKDFGGWADDDVIEYVISWFYHNFWDPAEEMPHVDGEYIYIWGGPYEPRDVLFDQFGGQVSDNLLNSISKTLSHRSTEWAPSPYHPDQLAVAEEYRERERYEEWLAGSDLEAVFAAGKKELEIFIAKHLAKETSFLHRMAFMQSWALLEGYLSGKIVKAANKDDNVVRRLYNAHRILKQVTFKGDELLAKPELPRQKAIEFLQDETYHALPRIRELYGIAFGQFKDAEVDFSGAMDTLLPLLEKRHDCVHRNGKTKGAKPVEISADDIKAVLNGGAAMVEQISKLVEYYLPDDKAEVTAETDVL